MNVESLHGLETARTCLTVDAGDAAFFITVQQRGRDYLASRRADWLLSLLHRRTITIQQHDYYVMRSATELLHTNYTDDATKPEGCLTRRRCSRAHSSSGSGIVWCCGGCCILHYLRHTSLSRVGEKELSADGPQSHTIAQSRLQNDGSWRSISVQSQWPWFDMACTTRRSH